jgi:hypothetical protein
MPRVFDRIIVCAYLAVAVLPAIAIYTRFDDKKVYGALVEAKRPKLAVRPFLSEKYQHQFTEWFEGQLGFKGYSVRVDNTLLYHVFDETKYGAHLEVGVDGVLYERDDLEYYSKYGPYLPTTAAIDGFAERVARVQAWFAERKRGFIPVIIPSKTTVYRAEIPSAWIRPIGSTPPSDEHVYRALARAFDARGVRYVDARDMIEHASEPREHVWGPDARHWSAYAACRALREVHVQYAAIVGRAAAPYECALTMTPVKASHVDHDLALLANAWGVERAAVVPVVAPPAQGPIGVPLPSALITGCSFSWTLLRDAERSRAFGALDMNYYNQTFVSWPADGRAPVEPGSPYWTEHVVNKDLVVLDLTETYIGEGTYSFDFVAQVAQAIGVP